MRYAVFAVAGLFAGSFLTVIIHRVPRRKGVIRGRSRCPACGAAILARDNIPLVGWLLLGGRCRRCRERISPMYPLVELGCAALFAAAAAAFGHLAVAAGAAVFMALMLAISLIDVRWRIVPNRVIYPALPAFAVAIGMGDLISDVLDAGSAALGLLVYSGPLFLIALAVPGGMGMGDVKLAALIGLALGSLGLEYVAVAAGLGVIGGGVGSLLAMAVLRYGRKQQIPFGPFLAGGAVVATLAGSDIASLYLRLAGLE